VMRLGGALTVLVLGGTLLVLFKLESRRRSAAAHGMGGGDNGGGGGSTVGRGPPAPRIATRSTSGPGSRATRT